MKNPLRGFRDWRRQEFERVDALGGWRLFWFYMTLGLFFSLWTLAATSVVGFLTGATHRHLSPQDRMFIDFVGGMFFGFVMWLLHLSRRTGRPAASR